MKYTAKISTQNPMAIVIMVDQSGSMTEQIQWNGTLTTKAMAVSEVINNLLGELVARTRSENAYRHYYDLMVIGYSGSEVRSLLASEESYFMSPAQLIGSVKETREIQRQRNLPDGRIVMTKVKQKIWLNISAEGRTPMRAAFETVLTQLKKWCAKNSDSFPPIVINITDGEATDGSADQLRRVTESIKSLSTTDGNALIMNVHLSRTSDKSVIFPTAKSDLPPDRYAELLFDLSSLMPTPFQKEIAIQHDHSAPKPYYGMAYNASISDLVRLLNIGSTTINHIVSK